MRVPGIQFVSICRTDELPANIELLLMSKQRVDLAGITLTELLTHGDTDVSIETVSTRNGHEEKVTADFHLEARLETERYAFVFGAVDGSVHLVGTKESAPHFTQQDGYAAPGKANEVSVHVEFQSRYAWIETQVATMVPQTVLPVEQGAFLFREVTDAEIDEMIEDITQ